MQVLVGVRQVEVKDYEVSEVQSAGAKAQRPGSTRLGRRPEPATAGAPAGGANGAGGALAALVSWSRRPMSSAHWRPFSRPCPQIMHSYRLAAPGVVEGRQRSCLYLQPQEERFFQAAGRAVAVYDYRFRMQRLPAPGDAPLGAAACVQTPKAVWQCV